MATGGLMGLLHADDRYAGDGVLGMVVQAMEEEVDGVYGDLKYIRAGGAVLRHWKAGSYSISAISQGWMPPHPTLFLRSQIYARYGKFDTSFRIAADYDFMLRVLKDDVVKLRYIPETLVEMRMGGVSNSSVGNILQKSAEDLRALQKNRIGVPLLVVAKKNMRKMGQFFGN